MRATIKVLQMLITNANINNIPCKTLKACNERVRNSSDVDAYSVARGLNKTCALPMHRRAETHVRHKFNCQVNNFVVFIY